jgi:hypothetical protein
VVVDAHHLPSSSSRVMRQRRARPELPASKSSQSVFALDPDTAQPLCCLLASSARCAAQYVSQALGLAARILCPEPRTVQGLDGDVRVRGDTIVVTYCNAAGLQPRAHLFEGLPETLAREGVDPRIPWLYGLKLDFRLR